MKKIIYLLGFLALGIISSCEKEVESTTTTDKTEFVNVTGQWEVTAYNDTSFIFGPFNVITLKDPSTESDSIIIQDTELKFWDFQSKAHLDNGNGEFQTELSRYDRYEETVGVKISNGKIVNSDSIYFEIQFEDDVTPYGNTYQIKGYRVRE